MEGDAVLQVNIRQLSVLVMSVPLGGVVVCFVTAYLFHDDINITRCPVYNFIPSVSAVTGVSPQRYLWRLCVALHIVPRALFAWLCHQHAARAADAIPSAGRRRLYHRLVSAAFVLNLVELFSLAGVTFVSNKENYPLHEKMFTAFIGACSLYMVVALAIGHMMQSVSGQSELASNRPAISHTSSTCTFNSGDRARSLVVLGGQRGRRQLQLKWLVFTIYSSLVLGLLYNFWKHRFYCEELAFSCFAFCEYCICVCVMVFHLLVLRDMPDLWLKVTPVVASGTNSPQVNGHLTQAVKCD